jgi:2-polyprenyl-6-methoxyphenol hydroxylase-like FAD-dependent oxidoreductase
MSEHKRDSALRSVAIIGGGLGGLALAQHLALFHPHLDVTVYERDHDQEARQQGFYIALNELGIDSLKAISDKLDNVHQVLTDQCNAVHSIGLLSHSLSTTISIPLGEHHKAALVNRWSLREALATGVRVEWNKRLSTYDETASGVDMHFEDGTSATADLMVACDGARSRIRAIRCPELQYKQVDIARVGGSVAVARLGDACNLLLERCNDTLTRALGRNGHSLIVFNYRQTPQSPSNLLWMISFPIESATHQKLSQVPENDRSAMVAAMADAVACEFTHSSVAHAVRTTEPQDLFPLSYLHSTIPPATNPLNDVTRVTMLGDALHAMTPHRGLGANSAFKDALLLAEALGQEDWRTALKSYQDEVFVRGFDAVVQSVRNTRIFHATGWTATARNAVLWCVGCAISVYFWVRG